jgi:hypothetical protein
MFMLLFLIINLLLTTFLTVYLYIKSSNQNILKIVIDNLLIYFSFIEFLLKESSQIPINALIVFCFLLVFFILLLLIFMNLEHHLCQFEMYFHFLKIFLKIGIFLSLNLKIFVKLHL